MEAVALTNYDLEIEDVEYLRHSETPLLIDFVHRQLG
jgi:hypothetical protein